MPPTQSGTRDVVRKTSNHISLGHRQAKHHDQVLSTRRPRRRLSLPLCAARSCRRRRRACLPRHLLRPASPPRHKLLEGCAEGGVRRDVADFVCILMASVAILLGSILYSQISYWMPSLEARLWYVNALSTARAAVDLATYVTVFSALLSLACQVAVTRSAWDILPFLPLLAVGLAMLYIQCTLSRDCKHYLTAELRLRPLGDGGALDA